MLDELWLGIANFATSTFTGITGVGGGIILIAIMSSFLPAVALVPLHGVTQFMGNASRAWFGRKEIAYEHVGSYVIGSLLGLVVFGVAIRFIHLELVPLFIGIYILLITWSDKFNQLIRKFEKFWLVGFIQTGLGVFVGTPGPLQIAVLNKYYDDNHVVVSTGALMASMVHFAKIPVYLSVGFAFGEYWRLLIIMIVMAMLGSWVGTKIRHKINVKWLKAILPYILTILAVKLIIEILIKEFQLLG